ncbi:MAG: hypothetical protein JXB49_04575 [Bacteroidales bacterium]|nr:hypothetical protein [Bacteroidales bacterium]
MLLLENKMKIDIFSNSNFSIKIIFLYDLSIEQMKIPEKPVLIFLFLIFSYSLFGQDNNSREYITVLAEIQNVRSTGKVHNSFIFTFKIKEVLDGETNDSILVFQEIFYGYGAMYILKKIFPDTNIYDADVNEVDGRQDVYIKYWCENMNSEDEPYCYLRWVAEKDRLESLEHLDVMLKSYFKNPLNYEYTNFLIENDGKFYFSDGKKEKMAIEYYRGSGRWIICTIDEPESR